MADDIIRSLPSWDQIGKSALGALMPNLYDKYNDYKYSSALQNESYNYSMSQLANEQQFSASEAQKARDWSQQMASTEYQRAVADMQAAGLNPASLFGSNFVGGSVPGASNASGASASSFNTGFNSHSSNTFGNLMSSAIQGMIAKDRDASKFLADEFRDNARHAHKMEEIAEWKAEKKAILSLRDGKDSIPY